MEEITTMKEVWKCDPHYHKILKECDVKCFIISISVSSHGVIGQFCRTYFTVQPAKFESCSFPACLINLRDILNILLTSFSWSVL